MLPSQGPQREGVRCHPLRLCPGVSNRGTCRGRNTGTPAPVVRKRWGLCTNRHCSRLTEDDELGRRVLYEGMAAQGEVPFARELPPVVSLAGRQRELQAGLVPGLQGSLGVSEL